MFINKSKEGKNNICGERVAQLRTRDERKLSQRGLAELLQQDGLDLDKNAIQRMENGKRFVTDIELAKLAKALGVTIELLIDEEKLPQGSGE